jgi:hypothetical protein
MEQLMLQSVQGIYRNGQIELLETLANVREAPVIVTFLTSQRPIDLRERGISAPEAANLRWRFQAFAEDWDRPDMDDYNDY